MRTYTRRLMGYCFAAITAVFISAFMLSQLASGASRESESTVNMGAILDMILSPKAISAIEPRSQWDGKNFITSDSNTHLPLIAAPFYCDVTGIPDTETFVYYVMNPFNTTAFGSVDYDSVTYSYWESSSDPYNGPFESSETPYATILPVSQYMDMPGQIIEVNALTGLWGSNSLYQINDVSRIYYSTRSEAPAFLNTFLVSGRDLDANAVPDNIIQNIAEDNIWFARSGPRYVTGGDLNFPDEARMPGQSEKTVRFRPDFNISIDIPITYAFYDAGLATYPEQVIAMMQLSESIYDAVDFHEAGSKSLLGTLPGIPLFDNSFFSMHYFIGEDAVQPFQDITPLTTLFEYQGVAMQEAASPLYERLALWQYPIHLDATTGQYSEPMDGAYTLATAENVSLSKGVFSAELSQDGLLVPLRTELWLDTPSPYVLAAGSEKMQPVLLKGIFPTWMGAVPESGVLPAEASLRYTVTTGDEELNFRTPENEIDGFDASYAISPVVDTQAPNEMYLWTATNLTENDNALIRVSYINADDSVLAADTPVRIEKTSLVATTVETNITVDPVPARISLSPEQSAVAIPSGDYPLETGRFFTSETVEASVDTDAGWGLVRWLQDDVELSTDSTYSFLPDSGDMTLTAAVASYALDVAMSPTSDWGSITLTPPPVDGTPGYAPGTTVTVEVTPMNDAVFDGWSGADADQLTIDPSAAYRATIVMDSDKTIEAVLRKNVRLTGITHPADSGAITYSIDEEPAVPLPAEGLLVNAGTEVTLTASAASASYRFTNWQIDDSEAGTDASLTITVGADTEVVANFSRVFTLELSDSPNGTVELVSPEPIECAKTSEKDVSYCFWENSEVIVRAVATEPEHFVLNAWWFNGLETNGTDEDFGEEYTLVLTDDTVVMADFQRKLRVDSVSLTALPVNRSIPVALVGVFPTWMGDKAFPSLTAEEAESAYEILIGDTPASFIAPHNSPFTASGEGITELDAQDTEATNTAYIWSPEALELDEDLTEIPVSIRDRINPLNVFEILLPKEAFVEVVTLSIETLPDGTSGVVLTTPEQGTIPGTDEDSLPLSSGEYLAGDEVALSAVPAYALMKYRITTETGTQEITDAAYNMTIAEDTDIIAVFDTNAYKLTLVDGEDGSITADPPASPGWPDGWYEEETEVTISATPNTGMRFVTWTHDLAGETDNPLRLIMDENKELGAFYLAPDLVTVNIKPVEGGDVVLQPEGIAEETNPNVAIYDANTAVRLIARPADGFRFENWRVEDALGDRIITANPWDLQLTQDYTIEPVFVQSFTLELSVTPEDSGEIIVTPPEPVGGYDVDTVVTLTAVPAEDTGYRFIQWTGASALDTIPNSTTSTVTIVMDSDKQIAARFSKFFVASIAPEETWIIGGIVAKVTGEALSNSTVVRFGSQSATVFDAAPSGQYGFVRVPALRNPGEEDAIKLPVEVVTDGITTAYAPGFTYLQRTDKNNLYTTAFIAENAGEATTVFMGRIGGRDATITLPPLGETSVYGIVRTAPQGLLAATRSDIAESLPGAANSSFYDVAIHLYMPRTGAADVPQYGVMSYEDVTEELLQFYRPYRPVDAAPEAMSQPALLNMALAPDTGLTVETLRAGISLWGVASFYDYLYNAETTAEILPAYQCTIQNEEVLPVNEETTPDTDTIRALTGARIYGGQTDVPANCFTWRNNTVLPENNQQAIKITAIDNLPVNGTGAGPVEGGTALTLTSPYGGLAWIQEIEFVGDESTVGGKVATRDMVSIQGEDEFLLEFITPKSPRPGKTSIVIRTKANPDQPIVLENIFEYTRPPIRWWMILLILIGLMFSVIGMATGF